MTELLTPFRTNVLVGPVPTDGGNRLQPLDLWGHDCLWWLDRMVRSRNQLVERMTLNLHDLFATSNAGVGNTRHMLRQNRLLRAHAVGNFHDLLEQITIDPAMLLWLNGADSNKWEPNENYGREVMELFCLGNDPNLESLTHGLWTNANMYTQNDIHEAARALTGWRYDWNKAGDGHDQAAREPDLLGRRLPRHRLKDDLRPHRQLGLAGRLQAGGQPSQPRALPGLLAVELLHLDAADGAGHAPDGQQLPASRASSWRRC